LREQFDAASSGVRDATEQEMPPLLFAGAKRPKSEVGRELLDESAVQQRIKEMGD
jgi:hypothetical protein